MAQGGLDGAAADAALQLEATMQRWRRRAMKRRLEQRAIEDLGLDLDVPKLDVLSAIEASPAEFDQPDDSETMVGTIAARLQIDPSRASRLITDLISSGHVRRAVSQRDARRTIVELTDEGRNAALEVRAYKVATLGDFLSSWSRDEIETFIPLFDRFSRWSEGREPES